MQCVNSSYYEKIGSEVHCIDEEIPFEIPKTWEWLRLQNCCVKEIKRGKSPKYTTESSNTLVFAQKCNTKYNGIDIGLAQYLDESILGKYPTDEYMQDGDIVINSTGTGTLGRVGFYQSSDNIKSSYYEKIGSEVHCIDEEIPFEIPKTWEWLRLQNCCVKEIKRGKSPKYTTESSNTLVFAQKCNTKYNGIDIGLAQYLDESILGKYPTDEYMQDGDIVINSTGTGTLGRVGFYQSSDNIKSIDIVPDSHVTVVRSYNEVDSFYLYAFMKSNQSELEKKGEGSTNQKELKPATLKEMLVPIPSISEQERISLAIQKAFSIINTIEKSLS